MAEVLGAVASGLTVAEIITEVRALYHFIGTSKRRGEMGGRPTWPRHVCETRHLRAISCSPICQWSSLRAGPMRLCDPIDLGYSRKSSNSVADHIGWQVGNETALNRFNYNWQ